jgi:hypothetical protein
LTEKLLLFGGAIQQAGEVKARGERRRVRSDWKAVEREGGISVSSPVMSFEYQVRAFPPAPTQGSINSRRQPVKSPTFRVARAAPRGRAMAAMRASASEIGCPARRRLAAMSANSRAAALPKGNTRPARSSAKIRSTTDSKDCRRLPSGSRAMPQSNSESVIAVVNNAEAGSARIHFSTLLDSVGRKVSDKTFVSRMIM